MRKFTLMLLALSLTAMTSMAGGYQVGLHSVRNVGMGLIGTSLTYDASSLFYNPGGVSFIDSAWSFSGGMSFIMGRVTFQDQDVMYQTHLKHELNTPFYFYGSYKATKFMSVGLAINTPYGNRLSWNDDWKGRFIIQNITFKAITFQPTVSFKVKNVFGFGAGLVIAYGNVNLNKAIPIEGTGGEGTMNLKGNTVNVGFNAGIMIHPLTGFNIGVDYRSRIMMDVTGAKTVFTVPASVAANFPENKADVSLPLPANLDFGASYEIKGKVMIGFSLNYVFWNTYDSLVFDFQQTTPAVGRTSTPTLYESKLIERLGVQWKINPVVTVRVGGYFDPSPVPDDYLNPQLPSTNEIGITAGLSVFPIKGLSIDAAFLYLMGMERSGTDTPDNFSGTYSTAFYIPGIGLTYNF